jgi:hypothetical protein
MKRLLTIVFAWSALAFGFAAANPARPLYEPLPPPKLPAAKVIPNMIGTTWLGKYSTVNRYYIFEADGTISFKTTLKANALKGRGNWRMEGNVVFFDHNLGAGTIMEFRGNFKDEKTIVGQQTMVKTGAKSNVTMQRAIP